MTWMVTESKLDPNQRDFLQTLARDRGRNFWIRGFAGSGKSVLVVHALNQAKRENDSLRACIVLFTRSLIDLFKTGLPEALSGVPVMTYHQFKKRPLHFDLILVDEVQDLPANVLELLRKHSKRLIVAGDEAQSIYPDTVAPGDIPRLTSSTPYALTILHRLTTRIVEIATAIFPDKQLETAKKSRLKNVDVTVAQATKSSDEVAYVWKKASENALPGVPIAILLPRHDLITRFANEVLRLEGEEPWRETKNEYGKTNFGSMNAHLRKAGLRLRYIGNEYAGFAQTEKEGTVVLMTYHSAKGLDFETVFLPFLNSQLSIAPDAARENTLFFVAVTRTRLNLHLSYTGRAHPLVERIPEHLVHRVSLPIPAAPSRPASANVVPDFLF